MDNAHAVIDVTATQPLIVVCINAHPRAEFLLRRAQQEAMRQGLEWAALHVETEAYYSLPEEQRARITQLLNRAETLGGKAFQVSNTDIAKGILAFAREHPVRQLILGNEKRSNLYEIFTPSLRNQLLRQSPQMEIRFIPLTSLDRDKASPVDDFLSRFRLVNIYYTAAIISAAYLLSVALQFMERQDSMYVQDYNVALIFLFASILTSIWFGAVLGLISALTGFVLLETQFIPLEQQFRMMDYSVLVTLAIFCGTSLLTAYMSGYNREYAEALRRRERITNSLYRISSNVFGSGTAQQIVQQLKHETQELLECQTEYVLCLEGSDKLCDPCRVQFSDRDCNAMQDCWKEQVETGIYTARFPDVAWHFQPMTTRSQRIGVFAISPNPDSHFNRPDLKLIKALADLSALAVERSLLSEMMEESKIVQEREKLRSALLSSVSHDLKTPLASIIGSLSAIRHMAASLNEKSREMLIETALSEAERLNRFISNILDMTRLEKSNIHLHKTPSSVREVIAIVTKRLRFRLDSFDFRQHSVYEDILVPMDANLIGQLLQNLLDNAMKYAPNGSPIIIESTIENSSSEAPYWVLSVTDHGPGIPEDRRADVFDKYTRLKQGDSQVAGTGLGLAICKAIAELHHGTLTIETNRNAESGARFVLRIPGAQPLYSVEAQAV
jgi:two-component system, OmpR family, sensor histidine kinase KdpD